VGAQDQEPADRTAPDEAEATEAKAETETTEREELSLDVIFEILKNRRRRDVIHYLREQDGRVPLGELAEHVAAIENDTTPAALTSSERKRVYVGLYQCHLPKMDDMGVVHFEQNRGYVELAPGASSLEPYIDKPEDEATVPWYRYYAGVSGLGVAAVVIATFGSVGSAIASVLFGTVVVLFGLCATAHWAMERKTDGD
jgi:hypothetical protein